MIGFHSLSCSSHLTHPHIKCRSVSAALHALAILCGRCDCARCVCGRCVCARCVCARGVCARGVCMNGQPVLLIEYFPTYPTNQPKFEFLSWGNLYFHSEVIEFWLVGWIVGLNFKLKSDSLSCSCHDTQPHNRRAFSAPPFMVQS